MKNEITIICLGSYGDIINATPIAKHYKLNNKFVRWIVKDKYKTVLFQNQFIDEIRSLKSDENNVILSRKLKSAYFPTPSEEVLFTAPYMSEFYDGTDRSTLLEIIKNETSKIEDWSCDFVPIINLSEEEIKEANDFLKEVGEGKKILIEFENFSNQTFLKERHLFKMFSEIDANFILTGIEKPKWFGDLKSQYPSSNFYFYNGSFKSNAEIYNKCDFFVGCCSGITCLTSSDYCENSIPKRIECCRGPHWSSLAWKHNESNKQICYNAKQFEEEISKWRKT